MKKITLEFDNSCTIEEKRVPVKGKKGMYQRKNVPLNNPKAWEVITVENSSTYMPGQRLNKKQVQSLCRGAGFDVVIGQSGQFRQYNSRY
tara:strand:+ start:1401 stop:1670 length:270 start_codon:yes stop_codon:yes gene_type:complete